MADRQYEIEEQSGPGRLGRHVEHDPKSLQPKFLVAETDLPVSKTWAHYIPILDQGALGSCTGNALVGCLGSAPFYGKLLAKRRAGLRLDEPQAVNVYSHGTVLDAFDGTYPPTDTGSSGIAVAKYALSMGWISQYNWITSLAAAHNAIKTGPFIVGINWYQGFDNPDSNGLVKISGSIRGGHEICVLGYSVSTKRWKIIQSWGGSWGVNGHFYWSDATMAELLSQDGDATVLVP